ncbi:spore coat U domain-containing protein [Variovorax sp. TBS-050B]|jgi:spore coat protein U-like protein|uniref:Csu type fimbrial protein n=1 Tax=Variovorax sp. TBS-050B TaxID=2940551 RepID=UPI002475A774|nr:spore coat U domain-containing protein [Variovorax sp. TBS-050B]
MFLSLALAATGGAQVVGAATATGNMTVQMTITQECQVNAGTGGSGGGNAVLDFGSHGVLNANIDGTTAVSGTGSIQVQCTNGTPYEIGLNAGANPTTAGDVNTRRMTNSGAFVAYQLYRDAGRTLVWGNTTGAGGNTVSKTADGTVQSAQVFGRVPPQTTPAAGTYLDTVVITVTY